MHIPVLDGQMQPLKIRIAFYSKKNAVSAWELGADFVAPDYPQFRYFSKRDSETLKDMGFDRVIINDKEIFL